MRRRSAEYWKNLYEQRTEQLETSTSESYELENVPGLLPFKKVKPNETKRKKITDVHGSLKASEVRELVQQKEEEDKQKEERKSEIKLRKEEIKAKFERCEEICVCEADQYEAIGLQKCTVCKNTQKSM